MYKRLLPFLLCLLLVKPVRAQQEYVYYLPLVIKPFVKKGVGATYGNEDTLGASWCHDWSADPGCKAVHTFPTIWGKDVYKPLGGNVKIAILFNEPEWQSDIEPYEGAQLTCLAIDNNPEYEFTTPSASIGWLNEWWSALECDVSRITWVNHHCYGPFNSEYAIAKCKGLYQEYKKWGDNRNIFKHIVTEFAFLPCWEGTEGSIKFLQHMSEFYEENDVLYAWFQYSYKGDEPWSFGPYCNTSLVNYYTKELTEIGQAYLEIE